MYIYISRETERVKYILATIALHNSDVDGIHVTLLEINTTSCSICNDLGFTFVSVTYEANKKYGSKAK